MAVYGIAIGVAVRLGALPWWVLPASLLLQLLTFLAYWQDKHTAGHGRWRTSENALHAWSLAGGWPGAWFAQQLLRHKSVKPSFRAGYRATAVLHCGALAGWLWWRLAPGHA